MSYKKLLNLFVTQISGQHNEMVSTESLDGVVQEITFKLLGVSTIRYRFLKSRIILQGRTVACILVFTKISNMTNSKLNKDDSYVIDSRHFPIIFFQKEVPLLNH